MKRRDVLKSSIGIGAALALPAIVTTSAWAQAAYTMRLSHVFPPQHTLSKLAAQYAEAVKMETGGKVAVEILGSGQAFAEKESYPAVAKGQIEATLLVSVQFSGIVPTLDALAIPFLLQGKDAAPKFLASAARKSLDNEIRARRIEPLAWLLQTRTSIFTSKTKPLLTPEDFAGLKIRGLNKVVDASFTAVKASALATPGSEVYQALESGVLDAAMTDVGAALSRRYNEVQKYGTVGPNHLMVFGMLIANPEWVKKLPPDLKSGLDRAAARLEASAIGEAEANVASSIDGLKAKGMAITVLSDEQVATWAKLMTPASRTAFVERSGDAAKAVLAAFDGLSK